MNNNLKTVESEKPLANIKTGKELGLTGRNASRKFIWRVCVTCGNGRWLRLDNFREVCKICSIRSSYVKWLKAHNYQYRENNPNWKGGKTHRCGYVEIKLSRDDPFYAMARKTGYVAEHRLIMAKRLGRCLKPSEQVHHIDGNKENNSELNLEIRKSTSHPLSYTAGYKRGYKDGITNKNNQLLREIKRLRRQLELMHRSSQLPLWKEG